MHLSICIAIAASAQRDERKMPAKSIGNVWQLSVMDCGLEAMAQCENPSNSMVWRCSLPKQAAGLEKS
jgi:hypothetical protein